MRSLEEETERNRLFSPNDKRERVILVSVSKKPKYEQEDSLEELKELAHSSDLIVLDSVIQKTEGDKPQISDGRRENERTHYHCSQ